MSEIKNLKKTAKRILQAIKSKENVILYGDADLDGTCSVIILEETLKNLGGRLSTVYFPDRKREGYGLNRSALNFLKKFTPALLITLDCGISNFEEVELANLLGFEVIIIDHHEVLEKLPQASIVVDPKQKGDRYPFKGLATAGIAYRLSQCLLKESQFFFSPRSKKGSKIKLINSLKGSFLELAALATLADLMPEKEDNREIIRDGLFFLENSWRPGLRVFLKKEKSQSKSSIREIVQKMIATLNISEIENHLTKTFVFLTIESEQEAEKIMGELLLKSQQRQLKIAQITKEIEKRLLKKLKEPIIFEGDANWPLTLIGSVASRICRLYKKPTFIYRKGKTESRGAVRIPVGLNGIELMKKCSFLLMAYGGHPLAAGFLIKRENLRKFKNCLIENTCIEK